MTKGETIIVGVAIVAVAVAAFLVGRGTVPRPIEGVVVTSDTTNVERRVRDTSGVVVNREPARSDTARLAVVKTPGKDRPGKPVKTAVPDTFSDPVDTLPVPADSVDVCADSVDVSVPIERVQVDGENYSAIIEGFHPRIIEMVVTAPAQIITNTRTVTTRKRWSFVVGPQIGVGLTPDGVRPYVGAGFTFGYCF